MEHNVRKIVIDGKVVLTRVSSTDNKIEFESVFFGKIFLARVDEVGSTELLSEIVN